MNSKIIKKLISLLKEEPLRKDYILGMLETIDTDEVVLPISEFKREITQAPNRPLLTKDNETNILMSQTNSMLKNVDMSAIEIE